MKQFTKQKIARSNVQIDRDVYSSGNPEFSPTLSHIKQILNTPPHWCQMSGLTTPDTVALVTGVGPDYPPPSTIHVPAYRIGVRSGI